NLPLMLLSPRRSLNGPRSCPSSQAAASLLKRSSAGVNPSFIGAPSKHRGRGCAEVQHLQNQFAVPRRAAQQCRARARALEVQVGIALPRESDAPVQLDRVRGAVIEGVAAIALGDGGRLG